MYLIDSNIIIYSSYEKNHQLRKFILLNNCRISSISIIETLGYHLLKEEEQNYYQDLIRTIQILPMSDNIVYRAVKCRQSKKMTLGDSILQQLL